MRGGSRGSRLIAFADAPVNDIRIAATALQLGLTPVRYPWC